MLDYIAARQIEQAIVALARQRGLDGNPFAERVPSLGTQAEEWAIAELYLDVRPRPTTDEAKAFTKKLARAIVMTRSPDLRPMQHTTLQQACHDYIDQLGGEHEVPEKRQTWHRDTTPDCIRRARSAAR